MRISDWSSDVCSSDLVRSDMDIPFRHRKRQDRQSAGIRDATPLCRRTRKCWKAGGRMLGSAPNIPFYRQKLTVTQQTDKTAPAATDSTAAGERANREAKLLQLRQLGLDPYNAPKFPRSEEHTSELQSL